MSELHLPPLAAETIAHVGKLPITNTMINTWLAIAIFLVVGLLLRKNLKLRPGKFQNFIEHILELIMGYFDQVTGSREKTIKFLPLAGSIFFFILLSNWLGLLPGVGSITWHGEPLLRSANTDLNLTVAMAVISVIVSHIMGFIAIGFVAYFSKFIQIIPLVKSFRHGPVAVLTAIIEFGVGLLEIISEVAKVISLSLRLFGNIFAGEVLMAVIASIISMIMPTPFMLLELLVGIIQASVFSILTLVYLTVATATPHGTEH